MLTQTSKRLIYAIPTAGLMAAIIWGFLPTPVLVELTSVQRGTLRVTVDEDGKTRIKEKYVVSSPLAGRLERVNLHAADAVIVGETLLARIEPVDPTLLDARVRVASKARVRAAEATVQQTDATLSRAKAALDFAESELGRARQLGGRKAISEEIVEEKQMRYRTCQSEYKAAKFGRDIATFELEQAKAALLRADPEDASEHAPHFDIHAPINGQVLRVLQESTTVVHPGMELLEIGDATDLEVEVDVLSSDAVRIQPHAHVSLEHWGGDERLEGRVRVVEPSAFTKVSALGVEEQRTNVIIDFIDPPEKRKTLGDRFRVDTSITIWKGSDVLKVPTGALFREGSRWAVFVVHEKRAELHRIEVGHRNDLEAEVLSGLREHDTVIIHPSDRVQDGVRIKVR